MGLPRARRSADVTWRPIAKIGYTNKTVDLARGQLVGDDHVRGCQIIFSLQVMISLRAALQLIESAGERAITPARIMAVLSLLYRFNLYGAAQALQLQALAEVNGTAWQSRSHAPYWKYDQNTQKPTHRHRKTSAKFWGA